MTPVFSALGVLPILGWSVHATSLRHRLARARRDPLTGLPTRDRFIAEASRLLRHRLALVVLIDLDRFKPLNDTYGHAAGDAALQAVAAGLDGWAKRYGGAAARIGGDEFAAAAPAPADVATVLAALHTALSQPIAFGGLLLGVGAHTAVPGTPLAAALRCADAAMYEAKARGGGWRRAECLPLSTAPARWKRTRRAAV